MGLILLVTSRIPRPGQAGIEQQRPAEPLDLRLVRVAEDADVGLFSLKKCAAFFLEFPAFKENMPEREASTAQLDDPFGRIAAPSIAIHVPGNPRTLTAAMLRHNHKLAQFGRTIN